MIIRAEFDRSFSFWPVIVIGQGGDIWTESNIVHERVHYKRQRWKTPLWVTRYFLFKQFRLKEEAMAFAAQIQFLVTRGYDGQRMLDHFARAMAEEYWGMCSYDEARAALEEELSKG